MEKEKFLSKIGEEIVAFADGFYYFCPTRQGGLAPHHLRWIADRLDELNKDWEEYLNENLKEPE